MDKRDRAYVRADVVSLAREGWMYFFCGEHVQGSVHFTDRDHYEALSEEMRAKLMDEAVDYAEREELYDLDQGDDLDLLAVHVLKVPAVYMVCPRCEGRGSYVNPDIDRGGISREAFDADPIYKEEYFSGKYNMTCIECKGLRVVQEPDPRTDYAKEVVKEAQILAEHEASSRDEERKIYLRENGMY